MFSKLRDFWHNFISALKTAYHKVFVQPIQTETQDWRDVSKVNFLDIVVSKLSNLCNNEATFEVNSDSTLADPLKYLIKDIQAKRSEITKAMLADGDYYILPSTDKDGNLYHSYLTQGQVRIVETDGEKITEAYAVIDWYADKANQYYYLMRHHELDKDGTLTISYFALNSRGQKCTVEKWADQLDTAYKLINAKHIGIGRYKSPKSSRGMSPIYGVPLNFGCSEIEKEIQFDLDQIHKEFKNAESKIFADPLILRRNKDIEQWEIPENIYPVQNRAGATGANIDIFNPAIRQSEHYDKLMADLAMYEKQIGTSRGVLTDNDSTSAATATEVRRTNADTISLINDIRLAIDNGNTMTLEADAVYLNVARDLWEYSSDWYDPFEDAGEQWSRLVEAKNNGVAEAEDLINWLFPGLSDDEVAEKIERIGAARLKNQADALEEILNGR